jgi:hypothetical protein
MSYTAENTHHLTAKIISKDTWRNAKLSRQNAKMGRQNEAMEGGGGQFRHFSNNSTMKQYFKMFLSHGGVYFFPSPYCSVKLCSSPFCVL